ncbi:hypothetical protein BDZ97DRAFT_324231 [Flammula alnicola]|nr:hypothetical protein BDZ97DRAFT_324231 [Flammula alnicola]
MAEEAHQEGNALYKAGQFAQSEQFYEKAASLNPKEPKHTSNLSAALYEQGKYTECISAVFKSWRVLKSQSTMDRIPFPPDADALAIKFVLRFSKANVNNFFKGLTSLHTPELEDDVARDIEKYATLERGLPVDAKVKEMTAVWNRWQAIKDRCSRHTDTECRKELQEAKRRLRALRIYKFAADPTLEHYTFGHDEIHSLLDRVDAETDEFSPRIETLDERHRSRLSYLFGGSGDARHVFGTLIDIVHKLHDASGFESTRVHLTLIDIHPATLARNLVIFALIHRISLSEDDVEKLELQTTLFYLYLGLAIPEYCNEIFMNVAKTLAIALSPGGAGLPAWLHVNERSAEAIVEVLQYWSTPLNKSTQTLMEMHKNFSSRKRGQTMFSQFPETFTTESDQDMRTEDVIYDCLQVLLPPKPLLHRHPELAGLVSSYLTAAPNTISAATEEVWKNWRPNPTLFDRNSTEHPLFSSVQGYPQVTMDPYQTLNTLMSFNLRINPRWNPPYGVIAFSIVSAFFENVVGAILKIGNNLRIEVVLEDAISGLPRLFAGDLGERPSDFPVTFNRIWLSNVPDYTNGILNEAVYVLPHHAAVSKDIQMTLSNCLLNTTAFASFYDFCYNYTLLGIEELPQFLGCGLFLRRDGSLYQEIIALMPLPLPLPLEELAPKAKLYKWLSHLLLCILCNGNPLPPLRRVDLPNNLNSLFRLLVHLEKVGFPSHWLGEFVQMIVTDSLITSMKPYLGRLPIPPSAGMNTTSPRKVHLGSWKAELEVILATVGPALPFPVDIPTEYPSFEDIRTYKAIVKAIDLRKHPFFRAWAPLSSPFVMTAGLIFYKPNAKVDAEGLAHHVSMILEGDPELSAVQTQIMLCAEKVDLRKGEIEWRISRKWYEKMKEEEWKMAVYRTDLAIATTEPLSAEKWLEVS